MRGLNAICLIRTDLPTASAASSLHSRDTLIDRSSAGPDDELHNMMTSRLTTGSDDDVHGYSTLKVSVFPSLAKATETPAHLLRGPWTQAKGNLLELVLRAIAQVREPFMMDSYGPRLSPFGSRLPRYCDGSDGLMDAIRERSVPAIRRLVGSVQSEARWEDKMLKIAWEQCRQGKLGGCVALPRSPWWFSEGNITEDVAVGSEDTAMTALATATTMTGTPLAGDATTPGHYPLLSSGLHLDAPGPWRAINEPIYHEFLSWPGIKPELHHLEAQLRYGMPDDLGSSIFAWLVRRGDQGDAKLVIKSVILQVRLECEAEGEAERDRVRWLRSMEEEGWLDTLSESGHRKAITGH